ncbi:MAG: FimV/HubP family polar landmark protein [Steroidobacteraceae bacterium]
MDLLVQYWYVPAALVAILIVLLVLRAVRARQEDAFDRSLGRLSTTGFESRPEELRTTDTMPVRALPPTADEQGYRVEESGAHEQPPGAAAALADTAASGRHVAIDDNVPTEAPVALDQGDPLAEADFHMAYGLYDQAADLVQIAISREPDRRDLRLKLLEVFFVWGNKDRFMQAARELAATRDKALPGEWEKIVIMGRQIAPEDPLFTASGALTGAASGGVDLNLEGGQNRIDFDLMGEPTVGAPGSGHASGVDLDLGAALGDTAISDADPTGESRPVSESGVDFVFDDADRGNEQTGSTREMPSRSGQATTMTAAIANDPDAPTVEQPNLADGDHPTIRQKIDAAKRGGTVPAEQTAELELHDLGLDLGTMETAGDETEIAPSADAPTLLAGTGEETRQMLHQADSDLAKTQKAPAPGEPTDSGTWLFTDTDFVDVATTPGAGRGADAPTEIVTQLAPRPDFEPQPDSSSTARLQAIESGGLDLDLGDLDKTQIKELNIGGNGLDLDVGAPASTTGSEGTFVQTQRIMAEDIPLPDLEPATMSEVGTKLDLARAYMDMGDPEGARSILSEVLSEGSVSQKQEARRLIDTLPG